MAECNACGAHVTADFVRVFGVEGAVDGCPGCANNSELFGGATARGDGDE